MFPVLEGSDFGSSMYSSLQVYENKLNVYQAIAGFLLVVVSLDGDDHVTDLGFNSIKICLVS